MHAVLTGQQPASLAAWVGIYASNVEHHHKYISDTLNKLALVSREWYGEVEAYCSHTLLVWKQKVEDESVERWQGSCWVEWSNLVTFTSSARMELVVRNRNYCAS